MEKTTAEHGDGKPAPEIKTTDLDQTTVLIAFFVVLITCGKWLSALARIEVTARWFETV